MASYPYGRTITRAQAVTFIAPVAYPNVPPRVAKKRVGARIDDATKRKGKLPKTLSYDAEVFFSWAAREWPQLQKVQELMPLCLTIKPSSAHFEKKILPPDVFDTPGPEELARAYASSEAERRRLEREIEGLRRERADTQLKKKDRRDNGSKAGKRGKGVKHKSD